MSRTEINLKSHAKINLSLRITSKRPDGYHEIVSLMQGTGLYDRVGIEFCPKNGTKYNLPHCTIGGFVVYLCTNTRTIPSDMSNLAFKGIDAIMRACSSVDGLTDKISDMIVNIDKRLPVAAGIAGGSGNAAVCMLGLNSLMGNPFSLRDLMRIGESVGADVPFSIFMNAYRNRDELQELKGIEEASDAAMVSGIGEKVDPVKPVSRYVILANPGEHVSTKDAYEAMDSLGYSESDADTYRLFVNDMERYTLEGSKAAAQLKTFMKESLGADEVLMSGSGPTIVAYYSEEAAAESGMKRIAELEGYGDNIKAWMTSTGI